MAVYDLYSTRKKRAEQAFERFVDDGFEFQLHGNRLLGGGAAFGD